MQNRQEQLPLHWCLIFSRPYMYLVRTRLFYSVASVCRLYGIYCG